MELCSRVQTTCEMRPMYRRMQHTKGNHSHLWDKVACQRLTTSTRGRQCRQKRTLCRAWPGNLGWYRTSCVVPPVCRSSAMELFLVKLPRKCFSLFRPFSESPPTFSRDFTRGQKKRAACSKLKIGDFSVMVRRLHTSEDKMLNKC